MDLHYLKDLYDQTTEGDWAFAEAPAEGSQETKADYIASALHNDGKPLYVVWVDNAEGPEGQYIVPAITGDGPRSKKNAEFIVAAHKYVPDLFAEIDRLHLNMKTMHESSMNTFNNLMNTRNELSAQNKILEDTLQRVYDYHKPKETGRTEYVNDSEGNVTGTEATLWCGACGQTFFASETCDFLKAVKGESDEA